MSIRLDPDVRAALEELAKSDDRSVSSYINRVLRQHVEGIPKKPKART
jgi:predicted transcriptional regulator